MINSVHKDLKIDGFHPKLKAYIKQLIEFSCKENSRLVLVVNDANDDLSKFTLDYIESMRAKSVTVLLREQSTHTILGETKYSRDKDVSFPVNFCLLVGNESYLLSKSNEVSGFYKEPEAAGLACSIIKRINKLFF